MKRIIFLLLAGSLFAASMSAQRGNNLEARKLQLALYAISNLYVDPTNETQRPTRPNWSKMRLSVCWKSWTRIRPIPTRKRPKR